MILDSTASNSKKRAAVRPPTQSLGIRDSLLSSFIFTRRSSSSAPARTVNFLGPNLNARLPSQQPCFFRTDWSNTACMSL